MRRLQMCVLALAVLGTAVPATASSTEYAAGISFRAPIDFATGATPSSEEFNRAGGDQVAAMAFARTPLSDSVAVGDFDGDGKPDVAQTNVVAGSVSVFLGDGLGGFAAPRQHAVGVSPVFVVASDLDGDGDLDLAVANLGSNDVAILRGDGQGGFLPAAFVSVPTPRSIAVGAFNGDTAPDLAVASSAPAWVDPDRAPQPTTGGVAILAGNAAGTFVPAQFIVKTAGGRPVNANYVVAGAFDGEAGDDLAVGVGISPNARMPQPGGTVTGDEVLVYLNESGALGAAQPFGADPDQRIQVGAWPAAIAAADLDGDTHRDLAVVDAGSGDITTLMGDGAGAFEIRAINVTVGSIPRSVGLGDFDADGNLDLATASFTASTVSVLAGNADGTFEPAVDFWSGDATTSVAVGDFNADGQRRHVRRQEHGQLPAAQPGPRGHRGRLDQLRLGYDVPAAAQIADAAQAFRWVRDHVGSREYGGDPTSMFVFGHSAGGEVAAGIATSGLYAAEQQSIRGLVLAGLGPGVTPGDTTVLPASLLLNGDEGFEPVLVRNSETFSSASRDRGAQSAHVIVPGRDHMTLLSDLALPGDPVRSRLLDFLRAHLGAGRDSQRPPVAAGPPRAPLPATGPSDRWLGLGVLMLGAAARLRPTP